MIKSCKCIGLRKGSTKDNKPFARVYIDVTDCVPYNEKTTFGTFVESFPIWDNVSNDIVGRDILCSVDRYGKVLDIEY